MTSGGSSVATTDGGDSHAASVAGGGIGGKATAGSTSAGTGGDGGSNDQSMEPEGSRQEHFSLAAPRFVGAMGTTALADFDGDGDVDVAVAGAGVALSINQGDGTFAAGASPVMAPDGTSLSWLAAGDVDGDGLDDLVGSYVTNPQMVSARETVVLLNLGDVTFGAARQVAAGAVLAVADLDGDERADLIVGDGNEGESLKVLLNDGVGAAFTGSGTFGAESGSRRAAVADLNGDDLPDFVVTTFNHLASAEPEFAGNVDVFLNMGAGGFQKAKSYPLLNGADYLAIADFSGDGSPDILATESLVHGSDSGLNLLVNDGSGAFGPAVRLPVAGAAGPLIAGDFDRDGKPDFGLSQRVDGPSVKFEVHRNGGGNVFTPSLAHSASGVAAIAAADLDGNGTLDLVSGWEGALGVLLSYPDGTLPAGADFYPVVGRLSLVLADVNGDARREAVVSTLNPANQVRVFEARDGDLFDSWLDYLAPGARSVAFADLNHDDRLDLVSAGSGVNVLLRQGALFATPVEYPTRSQGIGTPEVISVTDLNGDGEPDLVVLDRADFGDSLSQPDPLSVLLNRGNGAFGPPVTYAAHYQDWFGRSGLAPSDLDGDGDIDLVVAAGGGVVSVLKNDGTGTLQPGPEHAVGSPGSTSVGDVNGDKRPDLISIAAGTVQLRLNDGQGDFASPVVLAAPSAAEAPLITLLHDMNGDGKLDWIAAGRLIAIAIGHGDATFDPPLVYLNPALRRTFSENEFYDLQLAADDINADGKVDLCVQGSDGFAVLFNDGI